MNSSNAKKLRSVCGWLSLVNWIFFGLGVASSILALANGSVGGILIFGAAAFGLLFTMLCIQIGYILADFHDHYARTETLATPAPLRAWERSRPQDPDVPDEWLTALTKANPPRQE